MRKIVLAGVFVCVSSSLVEFADGQQLGPPTASAQRSSSNTNSTDTKSSAVRSGETLRVGSLKDWQLVSRQNQPMGFTNEYIQKGEDLKNWSEMITVQMMRDPGPMPPDKWVADIADRIRSRCGEFEIVSRDNGVQKDSVRALAGIAADYPVASALLHCTDPIPRANSQISLKRHEVVWMKAIRGFHFGYIVQRAWHDDNLAPNSVIVSDATRENWKAWIAEARVTSLPPPPVTTPIYGLASNYGPPFCHPQPIVETHTIPPYPSLAMRLGEQGTSTLSIVVGADGSTESATVAQGSGSDRLDQAAAEFVKEHWRWQPPKPGCQGHTSLVAISWNLKNQPSSRPASSELLNQTRSYLTRLGFVQSEASIQDAAKSYGSRIFKKISVSPNDLNKAQKILNEIVGGVMQADNNDLVAKVTARLNAQYTPQQIGDAIHVLDTPLGAKMARREPLTATEKQELGQTVLANPIILQLSMIPVSVMLEKYGAGIGEYPQRREATITYALCVGLKTAKIVQSGCDTATSEASSNSATRPYADSNIYCGRKPIPQNADAIPAIGCIQLSEGRGASGTFSGHAVKINVDADGHELFTVDGILIGATGGKSALRYVLPASGGAGYTICEGSSGENCPAAITVFSRNLDKSVLFMVSECATGGDRVCIATRPN